MKHSRITPYRFGAASTPHHNRIPVTRTPKRTWALTPNQTLTFEAIVAVTVVVFILWVLIW